MEKAELHGEDIIILEKLPHAFVWISVSDFLALRPSIKADTENLKAWNKYRAGIKKLDPAWEIDKPHE